MEKKFNEKLQELGILKIPKGILIVRRRKGGNFKFH